MILYFHKLFVSTRISGKHNWSLFLLQQTGFNHYIHLALCWWYYNYRKSWFFYLEFNHFPTSTILTLQPWAIKLFSWHRDSMKCVRIIFISITIWYRNPSLQWLGMLKCKPMSTLFAISQPKFLTCIELMLALFTILWLLDHILPIMSTKYANTCILLNHILLSF